MRFTVPFLLAIAVFTGTVLGANQTSLTPNEDILYDIVSASDAIAFRLERAIGLAEKPALIVGAIILTLPALLAFHLFRLGFGGALEAIVNDHDVAGQRMDERAAAARRQASQVRKAQSAEVLARTNAGDKARDVTEGGATQATEISRDKKPPPSGESGRPRLTDNLAAAFSRGASGRATAGTTSLTSASTADAAGSNKSKSTWRIRDRWDNLLDNRPDLSGLKSSATGLRNRLKKTAKPASSVPDINKDPTGS